MPTSPSNADLQRLRSVLLPGGADLTDGQLLECFVRGREPAALEALVRRHARMVWGVCRRVLQDHHDAEDALQATFLVLVRKAAAIRAPALLGNWLYGVAHQTALKARATRARRAGRERSVTNMPEPAVTGPGVWDDLQPLLDQELSRLPEKYRAVLVLCELEGKPLREVAQQLDLPQGTVASRLSRARALLARRLGRRGLVVSSGMLAALLSQNLTSAGVPPTVLSSTIQAVTAVAAGQAAGVVSLQVAALTERVHKAMFLAKLRCVLVVFMFLAKLRCVLVVLLVAVAVAGSGGVLYRTQAAEQGQPDRSQELKQPPGKGEKGAPKAGAAQGEAGEPGKTSRPTAERVKQVRQMYAKLPADILGFAEPTKRIVVMNKRGPSFNIILEDANGKKQTITLFNGPVEPVGLSGSFLLTSGRLPPRGPEESAVYGLLLRIAANPPEKTMPQLLQAVDAMLAVLDERIAGAMPITSSGKKN